MKHISELLAFRKMQLQHNRRDQQLSVFSASQGQEKGSREWNLFNPIVGDHVDAYRVQTPRKREELRYPNSIPIRRYPRHLTVRFAR